MQLVINIDEEDYYNLVEQAKKYPPDMFTQTQNNIINGTPIPCNATNRDVIKALFPNAIDKKVKPTGKVHFMDDFKGELYGIGVISLDWWDAPYKKGTRNEDSD